MDVKGYFVDSTPHDWGAERALDADGQPTGPLLHDGHLTTVENKRSHEIRGPFKTVRAAIQCAHDWCAEDAEAAKAKLTAVENAAPSVVAPAITEAAVDGVPKEVVVSSGETTTIANQMESIAADTDVAVKPAVEVAVTEPVESIDPQKEPAQ